MNFKDNIKKQSYVIAISVICLALLVSGTSYALFFQVNTNTNNQVIETGTLSVTYGANSKAISETNLVPMSDEDALTKETLVSTLSVENKGTLPAEYVLRIGNDLNEFNKRTDKNDGDKLLSHDYIRIAVYKNGELILEPTTLSGLSKSKEDENLYDIYSDKLSQLGSGNNSQTFAIKVWIKSDAPIDIIGDYVYLKVDVSSVVDETKASESAA